MFHLGVAFMAEGSPLVLDEAKVRQFLQQEVTVVTGHQNKSRKTVKIALPRDDKLQFVKKMSKFTFPHISQQKHSGCQVDCIACKQKLILNRTSCNQNLLFYD